jgi:hypothetical protein
MKESRYPVGWDAERVKRLIDHYDSLTDEEMIAEDESASSRDEITMSTSDGFLDDLIVPVYLNQRVVFDLLAMLKGGLAEVTTVSEAKKVAGEASVEVGGSFGLSKALSSLFRIDFSGKSSGKAGGEASTTRNEDRIHTPASLFIQLRALLKSQRALLFDTPNLRPQPRDIIEFSSTLKRNPFIETLDSFVGILEMSQAFAQQPQKGKAALNEFQKMKKQIEMMTAAVKAGNMVDLTTASLSCGYRCIITLEKQYLNDPTMSDLVDGTFDVVGKVIRVLDKNEGAISLNRKNVIGVLPDGALRQFQNALQTPEARELRLPQFEWEIPAPVIQVLPIAIFT